MEDKCKAKGLTPRHSLNPKWKKQLSKGRNTYSDGSIYEGDVKNGLRDGFGTQSYANGSYYRGQFKNDKREGYGEYQDLRKGNIYYGTYYQGKRHGRGKLLMKGEFEYNGTFDMGVMHGEGVMLVHNVLRYEGQFERGKWGVTGTIYTKEKQIQWDNKDAYEVFKKLSIPEDIIIELLEKYIFKDGKNSKRRVL